jgi:oxygen-independent coproporphyrinogen-3 oxidase
MKKIEAAALPGPLDRVALFLLAHERLTARGYQAIGIDHFALPADELAVAQRAGALHRNFMGYTTLPGVSLIGLGMSAISELPDRYVQQRAKLSHWWSAVEAGHSAVEKGCSLSAEDQLRRDAINALMCNLELRWSALEARHPDARRRLAPGLERLAPMIDEGLALLTDEGVFIPPRGRLLVRNAAMAFDAYLDAPSGGPARPRYSQTV